MNTDTPYWDQDPFKPYRDPAAPTDGGLSPFAALVIARLASLIENEGLTLYTSEPDEGDDGFYICEHTGGVGYAYDPIEREIFVSSLLPWTEFRWNLAVAFGCHLTRHRFFERESHLEWRRQGEEWASSFLAQMASRWSSSRHANAPAPKVAPTASKAESEQCRGTTAHGLRCGARAKRGTGFCRHHRDKATTLSAMSDYTRELGRRLQPKGSAS